jgi:hypothetical protein
LRATLPLASGGAAPESTTRADYAYSIPVVKVGSVGCLQVFVSMLVAGLGTSARDICCFSDSPIQLQSASYAFYKPLGSSVKSGDAWQDQTCCPSFANTRIIHAHITQRALSLAFMASPVPYPSHLKSECCGSSRAVEGGCVSSILPASQALMSKGSIMHTHEAVNNVRQLVFFVRRCEVVASKG